MAQHTTRVLVGTNKTSSLQIVARSLCVIFFVLTGVFAGLYGWALREWSDTRSELDDVTDALEDQETLSQYVRTKVFGTGFISADSTNASCTLLLQDTGIVDDYYGYLVTNQTQLFSRQSLLVTNSPKDVTGVLASVEAIDAVGQTLTLDVPCSALTALTTDDSRRRLLGQYVYYFESMNVIYAQNDRIGTRGNCRLGSNELLPFHQGQICHCNNLNNRPAMKISNDNRRINCRGSFGSECTAPGGWQKVPGSGFTQFVCGRFATDENRCKCFNDEDCSSIAGPKPTRQRVSLCKSLCLARKCLWDSSATETICANNPSRPVRMTWNCEDLQLNVCETTFDAYTVDLRMCTVRNGMCQRGDTTAYQYCTAP